MRAEHYQQKKFIKCYNSYRVNQNQIVVKENKV